MAVGKPRWYCILVGSEATDPGSESKRSGCEDKGVRLGSFEELQAARNRNEGELKPILCGLLLEP